MIVTALLATIWAYASLSRHEGSYVNVLLPSLIVGVPAYYLLPLLYVWLFGTEGSTYGYVYVYTTLAAENVAFVFAYTRTPRRALRLPFTFSYQNFTLLGVICLALGVAAYATLLFEFREFLLDPRQIYAQTRVGFGPQFFLSSTCAYLAIVLILFSRRSVFAKTAVVLVAAGLILLHGSKAQMLNVIFILVLHQFYVNGRRVGLRGALVIALSIGCFVFLLFAATMRLGESPGEAVESISNYSDYTRNAILVIDSHVPIQYGRLTLESNTISLVPRALMPNKRRDFGSFFLTDQLYPEWLDADASPAFGMGVQYADFGALAIVYIVLFALFKGWLARAFVNRLRSYKHPGDLFVVAFLSDVSVFPVGVGWFLPEALLVAMVLRYFSKLGADRVRLERPATPYLRSSLPRAANGMS